VLTFAGFLLLGGRAADIFGRRRVYLTGLTIFTVASIALASRQPVPRMIAVRALQGVGEQFSPRHPHNHRDHLPRGAPCPRRLRLEPVAELWGRGRPPGRPVDGYASWRWVFFINVPFGIAAAVLAMMYLREMRNRDAAVKLDITGAVLVTGSLAVAHLWSGEHNQLRLGIEFNAFVVFSAGAAAMVVFLFWELKVASHPLVPFRIFVLGRSQRPILSCSW